MISLRKWPSGFRASNCNDVDPVIAGDGMRQLEFVQQGDSDEPEPPQIHRPGQAVAGVLKGVEIFWPDEDGHPLVDGFR